MFELGIKHLPLFSFAFYPLTAVIPLTDAHLMMLRGGNPAI